MMDFRPKQPCAYILASRRNGTLYIGVTSNIFGRMAEHKQGLIEGFTRTYGVKMLVYYEMHETMAAALIRERRLKEWRRAWKLRLIESVNPEWDELFDGEFGVLKDAPVDVERSRGP